MLTAWSISRFRANLLAAGFMTGFSSSFGAEILAITPSMAGPAKVATAIPGLRGEALRQPHNRQGVPLSALWRCVWEDTLALGRSIVARLQ
jgi:hypothetical protein